MIKIIKRILKYRELLSKANCSKFFTYLRNGELLSAFIRIGRKLEIYDRLCINEKPIVNGCLYQSERIELLDVVDVIVPIYNAYEYAVKCVESIYENTNSAYNLYLINDCSTDFRINEWLRELNVKVKPQWMIKLVIVDNTVNEGFIGTVNKGLACSNNNVVILNTDTEVPSGWLQRLMQPVISDNTVASVTPFSNSATICSFPVFCKDNSLPDGISLAEIDALFDLYGSDAAIDIPTGVGFCMALNRKCLNEIGYFDEIYGQGYGEENDWCRRAVSYGYKNKMVTNLFVYHKHGASFGTILSKSKQERIEENLKILKKRYPDYQKLVDMHILLDPAKGIRSFIQLALERYIDNERPAELIINHSLGGGASLYIMNKISENKGSVFLVIELLQGGDKLRLTGYNLKTDVELYFNFNLLDKYFIKKLAACFFVNHIFINQLVDYPLNKIVPMVLSSGLEYDFFVHDFYCVCPRYNLLNKDYVYCNNEKSVEKCNICLQSCLICDDIAYWRKWFFKLLAKAAHVITPSDNTTDIVKSYYKTVNIKTNEHALPDYIHLTYEEKFQDNDVFHVSVLGAIGLEKGSKIVYGLVKLIRKLRLPIKVTVIGYTNLHDGNYVSEDGMFEVTGRYNASDVSDLLAVHSTNIVLIPSVWPETYSYTVSEAIYSGYKVLAFNMGAPADRIKTTGMGWLVDEVSSLAVLEKILVIMGKNANSKYLPLEFSH